MLLENVPEWFCKLECVCMLGLVTFHIVAERETTRHGGSVPHLNYTS